MALSASGSRLWGFASTGDGFSAAVEEVQHIVRTIIFTQTAQRVRYAENTLSLGSDFPSDRAGDLLQEVLFEFSAHETAESMTQLAVSFARGDPWPQWEIARELALGPHGFF